MNFSDQIQTSLLYIENFCRKSRVRLVSGKAIKTGRSVEVEEKLLQTRCVVIWTRSLPGMIFRDIIVKQLK